MSRTVRCSICHDLTDCEQNTELHVGTWTCCQDCWHKMQEYLTARGFTLMQLEAKVVAPPAPELENLIREQIAEHEKGRVVAMADKDWPQANEDAGCIRAYKQVLRWQAHAAPGAKEPKAEK